MGGDGREEANSSGETEGGIEGPRNTTPGEEGEVRGTWGSPSPPPSIDSGQSGECCYVYMSWSTTSYSEELWMFVG